LGGIAGGFGFVRQLAAHRSLEIVLKQPSPLGLDITVHPRRLAKISITSTILPFSRNG
jgi:hypothetical protein